ncbi:hypothetical protein HanHA300_Chr00c1130g0841691 [Helianthus annuus]|nr:hypothetical protein HanHA300_Chr00c1130g0841691 [Helianthus annuus]
MKQQWFTRSGPGIPWSEPGGFLRSADEVLRSPGEGVGPIFSPSWGSFRKKSTVRYEDSISTNLMTVFLLSSRNFSNASPAAAARADCRVGNRFNSCSNNDSMLLTKFSISKFFNNAHAFCSLM